MAYTGWSYYHCVWAEAIPRRLQWYAENNTIGRDTLVLVDSDKHPAPSRTCFPAWSWTACDNMVSYHGKVLRNHRVLLTASPISNSQKPALQMYGQLFEIKSCPKKVVKEIKYGLTSDPETLILEVQADMYIKQLFLSMLASRDDSWTAHRVLDFKPDSRCFDPVQRDLYSVPITAWLDADKDVESHERYTTSYSPLHTTGLVVEKLARATTGYIRVGLARHYCTDQEIDSLASLYMRASLHSGIKPEARLSPCPATVCGAVSSPSRFNPVCNEHDS